MNLKKQLQKYLGVTGKSELEKVQNDVLYTDCRTRNRTEQEEAFYFPEPHDYYTEVEQAEATLRNILPDDTPGLFIQRAEIEGFHFPRLLVLAPTDQPAIILDCGIHDSAAAFFAHIPCQRFCVHDALEDYPTLRNSGVSAELMSTKITAHLITGTDMSLDEAALDLLRVHIGVSPLHDDWMKPELSEHQKHYTARCARLTKMLYDDGREIIDGKCSHLYELLCRAHAPISRVMAAGLPFECEGAEIKLDEAVQKREQLRAQLEQAQSTLSPDDDNSIRDWPGGRLDETGLKQWPKNATGNLKVEKRLSSSAFAFYLP